MQTNLQEPVFDWENISEFLAKLLDAGEDDLSTLDNGDHSLRRFELQNDKFSGLFALYRFGSDVSMLVIDGRFNQSSQLHVMDGDWIRFNFALSITLDMGVVGSNPVNLDSPSWRIVDHPSDTLVTETAVEGAEARWVTIVCKRNVIEEITGQSADDLPDFLRTVGADQYRSSLYRDFVIRSRLMSIVSDIITLRAQSPIYLPYMKARATELLCLALDELIDPIDTDGLPALTPAEHEKIAQARTYIDEHFRSSPTVLDVARHAGLNRNSLFYGFKQVNGMNVSDYIQNLKLEEGRRLLLHSNLSIVDIAAEIGFKHQSGFTTAFRRKFSLTPGALRKK